MLGGDWRQKESRHVEVLKDESVATRPASHSHHPLHYPSVPVKSFSRLDYTCSLGGNYSLLWNNLLELRVALVVFVPQKPTSVGIERDLAALGP